jgi:hypothetical protein
MAPIEILYGSVATAGIVRVAISNSADKAMQMTGVTIFLIEWLTFCDDRERRKLLCIAILNVGSAIAHGRPVDISVPPIRSG